MRVDVIPIKELSENMKQDWLKLQLSNPTLISPFFHPELFVTVGQYCPDIYVALLYQENRLAGFWPFQKNQKLSAAQPMRFCNFEAIICAPDQIWDIDTILKKARLSSWNFESMLELKNIRSKNKNFQIFNSYRIDLTDGLEKYWNFIETKKVRLKDLNDKRRKMGIIKGPLRFISNCTDIKILHKFMQWKISRHEQDPQWASLTSKMLEHIFYLKDPLLKGVMPALYAGDELLAVDFHLRHQDYLGGLHRTFNPNFEKYSVGVLLLHDLINEHKALGYNIFDLGPGEFQYKIEYSNTSFPVIKGSFKIQSFKEKIKSINWLFKGLQPILKLKRKILNNAS